MFMLGAAAYARVGRRCAVTRKESFDGSDRFRILAQARAPAPRRGGGPSTDKRWANPNAECGHARGSRALRIAITGWDGSGRLWSRRRGRLLRQLRLLRVRRHSDTE